MWEWQRSTTTLAPHSFCLQRRCCAKEGVSQVTARQSAPPQLPYLREDTSARTANNSFSSTAARLMRHRTAWLLAAAWLVTALVAVGSATDRTPPVLAAPHHVRGTQGCVFSSMQRRRFRRRSLKGPAAPATACLTSGVHALCAGFSTHVTNHARQGCTAKRQHHAARHG